MQKSSKILRKVNAMKKRSLTALVLIFAMAMANPGLNNAAERSIPEKEKTENAGNKRETPATPSDLESKGNNGDASEKKQNIVSLVIPQKLEVVIDPFEIDGKTQVYSEKYSIKNTGETKGVLQLSKLACTSGKSGEVKVRKNLDRIHDGEKKKIYLEMVLESEKLKDNAAEDEENNDEGAEEEETGRLEYGRSENKTIEEENLKTERESEKHIVLSWEDTSYEQVLEAGEEAVIYFCGEVNENASQPWENGDVEITVVYDWKEMTEESEEEIEETLEIPETTEETEDEEINEKEQEPEERGKEVGEESTGEADAEKIDVENTAEGSKESLDEIKEGSEESNGSLEEAEERIEETRENLENIEESPEETEKDLEKTEENSEKSSEEETEGTAEEEKGENKENEKIPADSPFGEENSSETEEKTEESDHKQQEISSSEEKEDIGNTEDNEEKKDTEEVISNSPTVNTENKDKEESALPGVTEVKDDTGNDAGSKAEDEAEKENDSAEEKGTKDKEENHLAVETENKGNKEGASSMKAEPDE